MATPALVFVILVITQQRLILPSVQVRFVGFIMEMVLVSVVHFFLTVYPYSKNEYRNVWARDYPFSSHYVNRNVQILYAYCHLFDIKVYIIRRN